MELKKANDFIDKQIEDLEKSIYMFENIVRPRYEVDKKILSELRQQSVKMGSLMDKVAAGEKPTREEIDLSIPPQFR